MLNADDNDAAVGSADLDSLEASTKLVNFRDVNKASPSKNVDL